MIAANLSRAASTVHIRRTLATLVLGSAVSVATPSPASCESPLELIKKDRHGNFDFNATLDSLATSIGGSVQGAVDSGVPTQLSYGFMSGYCSGMALKKAGRVAAVVLGGGFVFLQTLSYYGYINVDHTKLSKEFMKNFDLDGDGKVDGNDAKEGMRQIMKVVGYNMPAGGGFAAGFIGGLRSG